MTFTAGEPQESIFRRKEQDNKSNCPWGPTWVSMPPLFLNVETRIKEYTGTAAHMQCTHACPLKAWMSGAWCLSVLEATLGLIDAELRAPSALGWHGDRQSLRGSVYRADGSLNHAQAMSSNHLREAPTHLEIHAACGGGGLWAGHSNTMTTPEDARPQERAVSLQGKHVLMDLC